MNTTTNTRGVSEAMVFASLLHEAKRLRDEFAGLPHSLGYEYTHLPSINAAIDAAEAALSAEPAAQGEARHKAFGIACTVAWTELHNAMAADGMNPPAKCGKATREWIEGVVQNEFASHAPPAQPAERVHDGLKLAIAHIQQKADAYAEENCGVEWDTGATTYHHGQAGEDYHHGLLELVDELTQLAAQPAERVPEGWVLVPREPTEEMLEATRKCVASTLVNMSIRRTIYRAMLAASPAPSEGGKGVEDSFQSRVSAWMDQCFLPSLYSNMTERGDRLLEEVLELLQSTGYDPARVATLVDYVWGRPVGEPAQEVGGVMVTLAGLCWIAGLNMHEAGDIELARINRPEVMEKIRRKQEAKNALHFDTPLPGSAAAPSQRAEVK